VGLIWKSAILDKSWQISETVLDGQDKVIDLLQFKILAYNNKNWNTDYKGNGTIFSEGLESTPAQSTTTTKEEKPNIPTVTENEVIDDAVDGEK
jgi:hypothetical protein